MGCRSDNRPDYLRNVLQYIVVGIASGALYGIVGVGIALTYRASGVVNFAHGEMATCSTFIVYILWDRGLPFGIAILGGLLFAAVLGPVTERVAIRPMRNASPVNVVIMTVALFSIFAGLTLTIFGPDGRRFPYLRTGAPFRAGDVILTQQAAVTLAAASIISVGLYVVFYRTTIGTAMRAIAESPASARTIGVPVGRILSMTWVIAAMTGALAGVLVAPVVTLSPNLMASLLISAFAAAVLGGLNSIGGALVGGVMVGILESLLAGYVSTQLSSTFTYLIIIAVLITRPDGLLGRRATVKL